MSNKLEIPENLSGVFRRLMNRIPADLRENEEIQAKCLAYLKLGGFSLALQRLESACIPFLEELTMFKRHLRENPEETSDVEEATDTEYENDADQS